MSLDSVRVYAADLDQVELDFPLPADERKRCERFATASLRHRFAQSRRLLRTVLAGQLDCGPSDIRFSYGPYGKPEFDESLPTSSLQFNLTHCEEKVLVALSHGYPLGIDLEKNRTLSDEASLAKHFFHPEEAQAYFALPDTLRTQGFFNAWTRKEALIKALGVGLSFPIESIRVELDPRKEAKLISAPSLLSVDHRWILKDLYPFPNTTAALAVSDTLSRFEIVNISPLREVSRMSRDTL